MAKQFDCGCYTESTDEPGLRLIHCDTHQKKIKYYDENILKLKDQLKNLECEKYKFLLSFIRNKDEHNDY